MEVIFIFIPQIVYLLKTFDDNIIKPERAVQILKDDGMIVTIEQANIILEFLYKLADIALSQHFPK